MNWLLRTTEGLRDSLAHQAERAKQILGVQTASDSAAKVAFSLEHEVAAVTTFQDLADLLKRWEDLEKNTSILFLADPSDAETFFGSADVQSFSAQQGHLALTLRQVVLRSSALEAVLLQPVYRPAFRPLFVEIAQGLLLEPRAEEGAEVLSPLGEAERNDQARRNARRLLGLMVREHFVLHRNPYEENEKRHDRGGADPERLKMFVQLTSLICTMREDEDAEQLPLVEDLLRSLKKDWRIELLTAESRNLKQRIQSAQTELESVLPAPLGDSLLRPESSGENILASESMAPDSPLLLHGKRVELLRRIVSLSRALVCNTQQQKDLREMLAREEKDKLEGLGSMLHELQERATSFLAARDGRVEKLRTVSTTETAAAKEHLSKAMVASGALEERVLAVKARRDEVAKALAAVEEELAGLQAEWQQSLQLTSAEEDKAAALASELEAALMTDERLTARCTSQKSNVENVEAIRKQAEELIRSSATPKKDDPSVATRYETAALKYLLREKDRLQCTKEILLKCRTDWQRVSSSQSQTGSPSEREALRLAAIRVEFGNILAEVEKVVRPAVVAFVEASRKDTRLGKGITYVSLSEEIEKTLHEIQAEVDQGIAEIMRA